MSRQLGICPRAHTASSIPLSKVVLTVCVSKSPPKAQWPGHHAESLAHWEDLASAHVTDSSMSSPHVSSLSNPVALSLPLKRQHWHRLAPSLPLPGLCFAFGFPDLGSASHALHRGLLFMKPLAAFLPCREQTSP